MEHPRAEKFGGAPQNLPHSDLPTYSDVARCFWKACETERTFKGQLRFVENELLQVWAKCSSVMPLINISSIRRKLDRFLINVRNTSYDKKCSPQLMDDLDAVAQKLFDISACTCELPAVDCRDPRVNCRKVKCRKNHIVCLCAKERRVPELERRYLRDQRLKVGTFGGCMQMAGPDRSIR